MTHPFDASSGLIVVPADFEGPDATITFRLALDTGATRTTLGWECFAWLGYDPAISKERTSVTTGSDVVFCPQVVVASIRALGLTRRTVSVVCHTLPPSATVDGVLGLDFFRGRRLIIDFTEGLLRLEP